MLRATREETRRLGRSGPVYSRELQGGVKGEGRPQVATVSRALDPIRPQLEGEIQAFRSAGDGAGSGKQRSRTLLLGERFQSLAYFTNELFVSEGVSALGNYFSALQKQVQGGAAEPGPSGA